MAWLEDTLSLIEEEGGIAYIIGHIQPKNFQHMAGGRYRILMERYQHIIRTSLFGHTHDQYYGVTNAMTDPTKHIGV